MSTHATATEEIMRAWATIALSSPLAGIPTEYENRRFARPPATPWGRVTLRKGKTTPQNIGSQTRIDRTAFVFYFQIFIPEGQGTRLAEQVHDAMKGLNYLSIPGANLALNFETASMESTPEPAGSGFAAFNASIPGYYDLITTNP